MKKNHFLLIALVLILISCSTDGYKLTATVSDPELEGKTVLLRAISDEKSEVVTLDSTVIKDGVFTFSGKADAKPSFRLIELTDADAKYRKPVSFILESGNIQMTYGEEPTVGGTPKNDEYQILVNAENEYREKRRMLDTEYLVIVENNGEPDDEFKAKFEDMRTKYNKVIVDFVTANSDNPLGPMTVLKQSLMLGDDTSKELLDKMPEDVLTNSRVSKLRENFIALEALKIGKKYIDVSGLDKDGKTVYLSEYVGNTRYLLIDFWASWCGPCIMEMPNLKNTYKNYKAQGFEVIGISIDKNTTAWAEKVNDLELPWAQMIDNSDAFNNIYAIRYIPHTILLDKEGTIIAKDLRGDELDKKLAELF